MANKETAVRVCKWIFGRLFFVGYLFFGAIGGITVGLIVLFVVACIYSFLIDDAGEFFQREILVVFLSPFAILGAAFPKFTSRIGQAIMQHWP